MTQPAYYPTTWYEVIAGDIIELIKAQPQQVLLSTGSVMIVAAEAQLLVPPPAHIAVAIGAEWAYLRGIASSGKGDARWVNALNWGALALVVIYGMLWGGRKFGALAATVDPGWAWLLTAVHIVPLAFVSLAAAAVHRSAVAAETSEQERRTAEAEQRERERLAWQESLSRRQQETAAEIEAERARRLMDVETRLQARQLREQSAANTANSADTGPSAASGTATNSAREHLRAQVVRTLREQPKANKTKLAEAMNIGRTLLYDLIKEAKERGELEA